MALQLTLSTRLEVCVDEVWTQIRKPRLLGHVAFPLLRFVPIDPDRLPDEWSEGRYLVRMFALGIVPVGAQWVVISYESPAPTWCRTLRDDGSSKRIQRWEHTVTVCETEEGVCRYTDDLIVEAGRLTGVVYVLAWVFFRHRQRRLRALAKGKFRALSRSFQ